MFPGSASKRAPRPLYPLQNDHTKSILNHLESSSQHIILRCFILILPQLYQYSWLHVLYQSHTASLGLSFLYFKVCLVLWFFTCARAPHQPSAKQDGNQEEGHLSSPPSSTRAAPNLPFGLLHKFPFEERFWLSLLCFMFAYSGLFLGTCSYSMIS